LHTKAIDDGVPHLKCPEDAAQWQGKHYGTHQMANTYCTQHYELLILLTSRGPVLEKSWDYLTIFLSLS